MHIPAPMGSRRRWAVVVVAAVACSTAFMGMPPAAAGGGPAPSVPAPELNWAPCVPGSPFDCATAEVPLDYGDPGGRTVELAVVRKKATGPGARIGTLFFNPGGPGGPGSVQMPQNYELFPQEVRERFDIVSWDPRGVGNSTAVNCFTSAEQVAAWSASRPTAFPVGQQARDDYAAAYEELGQRCEQRDRELLRHVSTADTARDLDQLRRAVGDAQLNYLGISYGTFLGATYANLFPGKVRAMVLDSNWDPKAWTGQGSREVPPSTAFLRLGADRSAAATLKEFLALCGSASTDACAFSAGGPEATREKYDELMRRLRARPVGDWTYARTVEDVVNGLYVVHPGWTDLAGRLQDLWQGRVPEPLPAPPEVPIPDQTPYTGEEQPGAVLCGDSPNPRDVAAYHSLEEASAARTGDMGRHWAWAAGLCAGWPVTAASPYRGPWDRPTAHPVLVIGTTYDPSTPYAAAQAMAGELADARLLTVSGHGHTALLNPSGCVQEYEGRYFVDGVLPPAGTTCQQDAPPFSASRPRGAMDTGGGWMASGGDTAAPRSDMSEGRKPGGEGRVTGEGAGRL
ncbi:alpha/beta hydrolase [Streptomyces sp. NPDC096538]|uniref:alpha/beta hydrolase n=1 Tax=Streptomyces sp. NPDC096538 TaxID=3155427 RepID=UPI00332DD82C